MNSTRCGAVIFDKDGTLVDSEPFWKQAEREIFGPLGIELTAQQQASTTGWQTGRVIKHWLTEYKMPLTQVEKIEQQLIQRVIELIGLHGKPLPGVIELLEHLSRAGIAIGVASNSPVKMIDATLNKLNIKHYFSAVAGYDMVDNGKPAPDVYLLAAKQLDVAPSNVVAFEDTVTGALSAVRAGMKVWAVPSDGQSQRDFEDIGVSCIDSLRQFDYRTLEGNI